MTFMKTMILALLLATAGFAGAQDRSWLDDEAVYRDDVQNSGDGEPSAAKTEAPVTFSRTKRSVAPIVGMACEHGYKSVGDDCVAVNVEFE
jgi:hypothetical protein